MLIAVSGWMNHRQRQVIEYLLEENRVLREQLGGRRVRLDDNQRRRLAIKAKALGRKVLVEVATNWPSRPEEFHPEPLTDPDMNFSIHPARAPARKAAAFCQDRKFLRFPVDSHLTRVPTPFAPRTLLRFIATTDQCAPDRCIGTFSLVGSPLEPFPLASPTRFSSSIRKPG